MSELDGKPVDFTLSENDYYINNKFEYKLKSGKYSKGTVNKYYGEFTDADYAKQFAEDKLGKGIDVPTNSSSKTNIKGSSYKERYNQTPSGKTGEWVGDRAESLFIPKDIETKKVLEKHGLKGIEYKNGIPDFTPVSKADVKVENMTVSRYSNFSEADKKLAKEWGVSEKEIQNWRKENKYTWHEMNDTKTMQLIPSVINSKFGHLGGVGELK